jgi:hypothetical protein
LSVHRSGNEGKLVHLVRSAVCDELLQFFGKGI